MADDYLARSSLAAQWMYPVSIPQSKHYHMARNAIDVSKYNYNPHVRADVRQRLKISDDTFVIGHVGRFTYQKNHEFLINVFKEVHLTMKLYSSKNILDYYIHLLMLGPYLTLFNYYGRKKFIGFFTKIINYKKI
ncbi:hypothetical protein [Megasphaera sp.]|uniref:hypothetical protein n=1 Tax=Megasphaera sp. TaxID=2023260 RepID=UPI00266F287B|nr:hypothetical protein [uncultured Megasphaera sp.]